MKRIITAAILIPLVLLLIFKGSFIIVLVAAALVAELAAWECLSLADRAGARVPRFLVLAAIALLFAAAYVDPALEAPALLLVSLVVFIVCAFRSPLERVLPDTASSIFCLVYVGLSLTTIPLLWVQGNGPSLVLFLLCVVWCGDVAALYVGRAFGRRKLAPNLSPNKTWEGSAASIAGSVIAAIILYCVALLLESHAIFAIGYSDPLWRWAVLAVVLNLAAQVGDLAESAIKRGSGTKDSGVILPGHGGMLDRVDALLLAAPLLWCVQFVPRYF
jgi:phosphatidate cytidylyltransferase